MKIKTRLTIVGILLAAGPCVLGIWGIGKTTMDLAAKAMLQQVENQLTVVRETTANNLESYFHAIDNQVITFSSNLMVERAMGEFADAFAQYPTQPLSSQDQELLEAYYREQFAERYQELNLGESPDTEQLLDLSPVALNLQASYIARNPHPLGEKDTLQTANQGTRYDAVHQTYHATLRQYLQKFGYYDIFLVDADTGHVVYSVFKELDFATSLKTGPYADSGIAEAYRRALQAQSADDSFLVDFAPYTPSYSGSASFISSPIYTQGRLTGVLIFQMPVDEINSLMTHGRQWSSIGLGASGETYLVGPDKIMRSAGRRLIESPEDFKQHLLAEGYSEREIKLMLARESTLGIQRIDTDSVKNALQGQAGFHAITSNTGQKTLSSYRPVAVGGLSWALLSEISEAEALVVIGELQQQKIQLIAYFAVGSIVFAVLISGFFANYTVKPLSKMVDTMNDIARGEGDLRQRVSTDQRNEIGDLGQAINSFIGHIDSTLSSILKTTSRLVPISQDLYDVNWQLSNRTEEQKSLAGNLNQCLTDTNEATSAVTAELDKINDASNEGKRVVDQANGVVTEVETSVNLLAEDMQRAVAAMDKLKGDIDGITDVIEFINSIAEQTNLLALNAAIEAARAGESGRGFAVVADEVRSLAAKTRESTDKVAAMVATVHESTGQVVSYMQRGQASTDKSTEKVQESSEQLGKVLAAIDNVSQCVGTISVAINTQRSNFESVTTLYAEMSDNFQSSDKCTKAANLLGKDIDNLGTSLQKMVQQFKVTDDEINYSRRSKIRGLLENHSEADN